MGRLKIIIAARSIASAGTLGRNFFLEVTAWSHPCCADGGTRTAVATARGAATRAGAPVDLEGWKAEGRTDGGWMEGGRMDGRNGRMERNPSPKGARMDPNDVLTAFL